MQEEICEKCRIKMEQVKLNEDLITDSTSTQGYVTITSGTTDNPANLINNSNLPFPEKNTPMQSVPVTRFIQYTCSVCGQEKQIKIE